MHTHTHTKRGNADARLAKIEGHVKSIRKMLNNEEKECEDILIQISAVQAALKQVSMLILEDHLAHCIVDHTDDQEGQQVVQKFTKAIQYVVKNS